MKPIWRSFSRKVSKKVFCPFTTDYQSAYRDPDVIFIGVGTPELPDGSANLSYVASVARQIAESVEKDCLVVVKSTVPVGTTTRSSSHQGLPGSSGSY